VEDPNDVQGFALRRILLFLVGTLSNRANNAEEKDEKNLCPGEIATSLEFDVAEI
jgi:hypothetical protein